MRWFIYRIKEGFEGDWDEAIALKQCETVVEIYADDWYEAHEKASELGYGDTDTYGITNINEF